MGINKSYCIKFVGMLLVRSCYLPVQMTQQALEKPQLHLQASDSVINVGDNVSFEVTANGSAVDADIYIDSSRIYGSIYTFNEADNHTTFAKKEGYTNSEKLKIQVNPISYTFRSIYVSDGDVYIAGYLSLAIFLIVQALFIGKMEIYNLWGQWGGRYLYLCF